MEEEEEAIMSEDEKKKRKKKFACGEDQDDYFARYIPPAKSDLIGV